MHTPFRYIVLHTSIIYVYYDMAKRLACGKEVFARKRDRQQTPRTQSKAHVNVGRPTSCHFLELLCSLLYIKISKINK